LNGIGRMGLEFAAELARVKRAWARLPPRRSFFRNDDDHPVG
jgi:hypothetical protein